MKLLHKITLEWIPTDLNSYIEAERRNRFSAAKIKRDETDAVEWKAKMFPRILEPRVHIRFEWHTKDEKKDPDNISFTKKFIIDGFVKAGMLKNDGRKNIGGFSDGFITEKEGDKEWVVVKIFDGDPCIQLFEY